MKKAAIIFLQCIVVLLGLAVFTFLILEPQWEGRNAHASLFAIYFQDAFLAYIYAAAIFFFAALVQAFKLLGRVKRNQVFTAQSVKSLRTIKRCAMTVAAFAAGAEVFFGTVQKAKGEDIAGGVAIGLFILLASTVAATAAGIGQRLLQSAVDMKSENDLTV